MLTLQKPGRSSMRDSRFMRMASITRSTSAGFPWLQRTRQQAPSGAWCTRWRRAISHSFTSGVPPSISAKRRRLSCTADSLLCIASSVSQAVVAMQRPLSRSHIIDRPIHPSISWTAGMTSSRM